MPQCKNDENKTYNGTEPSPKGLGYCAHAEKVDTIRKGRDKNDWIVKKYGNIKRWVKYKKEYDLSNELHFRFTRNNSVIKSKTKIQCLLSDNELIIISDNMIMPVKKKIIVSLSKVYYDKLKTSDILYLQFKQDGYWYEVYLKLSKKNSKDIMEIIHKKCNKGVLFVMDMAPIIKDHHYGDLILFKPSHLKNMIIGQKYYIIWGQAWYNNYNGLGSIAVIEYKGYVKETDKKLGTAGCYGYLLGSIIWGKNKMDSSALKFYTNTYVNTGSGMDPVYLVSKWRKGFNPPKGLPKAKLFK